MREDAGRGMPCGMCGGCGAERSAQAVPAPVPARPRPDGAPRARSIPGASPEHPRSIPGASPGPQPRPRGSSGPLIAPSHRSGFLTRAKGYTYTRSGNPSRHVLEKVMTALDGAKHRGQQMDLKSLAYSSGMAAILNICYLLKPGDAIVCIDDVYSGTRELFDKLEKDYNIKVRYVDCTDLKLLEAAIASDTKLVWLESPTNPTLKVIDIKACADVAHKYKDVLVAVDNSLMSPYFQRPLSLGADICISSATKYINGHCDVLMGLVSVNRDDLYESLKHLQSRLGAVPSPFDCYMCNRGLKTLHIRMKLHFKNGLAVAKFLEFHSRVEKVLYPGLPSHPQHEVMKKQCTGGPGILTFYIKGKKKNASAFLKNLKVK
uniref:cystathionine gamma-lyase n=1 Tax=Lonchura striata TaxID=40157 RepID=UPI000B4D3BAF|nr:cystathionine gamma-lyase [Lonchura striata domestica]